MDDRPDLALVNIARKLCQSLTVRLNVNVVEVRPNDVAETRDKREKRKKLSSCGCDSSEARHRRLTVMREVESQQTKDTSGPPAHEISDDECKDEEQSKVRKVAGCGTRPPVCFFIKLPHCSAAHQVGQVAIQPASTGHHVV